MTNPILEVDGAAASVARWTWPNITGRVEIPVVFIELRPEARAEGTPTENYVVATSAGTVLNSLNTLESAIGWAKDNGFTPLIALVRHPHKGNRDHWRRV